jgi:hypothetical protein
MEELLRRLYAEKDRRVALFNIAYRHDAAVRTALHAEWEAIEKVTSALRALEQAEANTNRTYYAA